MAVSLPTDVVFIAHRRKDANRFAELVSEFYERRDGKPMEVWPMESADHAAYCRFFYFGVDYADDILLDSLKREPWDGHTVLWIEQETHDGPNIQVDGQTIQRSVLEGWR